MRSYAQREKGFFMNHQKFNQSKIKRNSHLAMFVMLVLDEFWME